MVRNMGGKLTIKCYNHNNGELPLTESRRREITENSQQPPGQDEEEEEEDEEDEGEMQRVISLPYPDVFMDNIAHSWSLQDIPRRRKMFRKNSRLNRSFRLSTSLEYNDIQLTVAMTTPNNDLHILFHFLEGVGPRWTASTPSSPGTPAAPPTPLPAGSAESEERGYWRVVQALQRHDQYLEGMLLRNIDPEPQLPYVHYVVFNTASQGHFLEPTDWHGALRHNFKIEQATDQVSYKELYTFIDPALPLLPKRSYNPHVGYILSVFKTVGDLDQLDKSWSLWSGANFIARHVPPELRLQRVTFHKNLSDPLKDNSCYTYILMCELAQAMVYPSRARDFVEKIRDRMCGYTSLYVIEHYF